MAVAVLEEKKQRLVQRQREEVVELRLGKAAGPAIATGRFFEFVRIVVLIASVAAFLWLCQAFGISLLAASLALITIAVCGVLARCVPEQYRIYYYMTVIAAAALLVGLMMKGAVPLSSFAIIGGEYATLLDAIVANVSMYIMLLVAPIVALVLRLIAEGRLLASIFRIRRAVRREESSFV